MNVYCTCCPALDCIGPSHPGCIYTIHPVFTGYTLYLSHPRADKDKNNDKDQSCKPQPYPYTPFFNVLITVVFQGVEFVFFRLTESTLRQTFFFTVFYLFYMTCTVCQLWIEPVSRGIAEKVIVWRDYSNVVKNLLCTSFSVKKGAAMINNLLLSVMELSFTFLSIYLFGSLNLWLYDFKSRHTV